VPAIDIRDATENDLNPIAEVAVATGQDEEWAAADPAYTAHLLAHGHLVVACRDGVITGYGATLLIGEGAATVSMLCDLFVDPRAHGLGCGQAMLAALWRGQPRKMTFSSQHPHALPLYTRAGLDAWWPLLYLAGDVRALGGPPGGAAGPSSWAAGAGGGAAGWAAGPSTPERVAVLEQRWTGADRAADHRAWAARPAGQAIEVRRDGEVLAAGTVAGDGPEYGLAHMAVAPAASDDDARDAVMVALASLDPPDGRARVCLPGPHPAVRPLLAAGWRNDYIDLFMATEPGLLDPRRAVPSPAMA
jgi:GNAT superfamily N-acetyltransferase